MYIFSSKLGHYSKIAISLNRRTLHKYLSVSVCDFFVNFQNIQSGKYFWMCAINDEPLNDGNHRCCSLNSNTFIFFLDGLAFFFFSVFSTILAFLMADLQVQSLEEQMI